MTTPGVLDLALPSRTDAATPRWQSEEWLRGTTSWVAEALGSPLDALTVTVAHVRPWSVVLRLDAETGRSPRRFWVKENCPGQNFEAPLAGLLDEVVPDQVLTPVALEVQQGLLLTSDQGPTLREGARAGPDAWVRVVLGWAELQRSLLAHHDRLVASGVVPLPPERSHELASTRAELLHALPLDDPRRLDDEGAATLERVLPDVARWAEQVSALGLPLALNHNDLHDNNVFDTPAGQPLRFFDFGDCLLTDPLSALRVPLAVIQHHLECAADDPRLVRVSDAFCEVWSDLAPLADLRAALPLAMQLGALQRHESWLRCQPSMTDAELADDGPNAADWLTMLAEEPLRRFGAG